jgi:sugar lactone lactonase YvrE
MKTSFFGTSKVRSLSLAILFLCTWLPTLILAKTTSFNFTTIAGQVGVAGSSNGTGSEAQFYGPQNLAVDAQGNIYVADASNEIIRKITPGGVVTTLAGQVGVAGNSDGTGNEAQFNCPTGIALDKRGNIYVSDALNQTIRKITPGGVVTTLAGQVGVAGNSDGTGNEAQFDNPIGIALDSNGNIYAADFNNDCIRKITPRGVVTTIAGNSHGSRAGGPGGAGVIGSADGTGSNALFNSPSAVAVDSKNNI